MAFLASVPNDGYRPAAELTAGVLAFGGLLDRSFAVAIARYHITSFPPLQPVAPQPSKMDWKAIFERIKADQARIAAHLRDPKSVDVSDIKFITPLSLPLGQPAGE